MKNKIQRHHWLGLLVAGMVYAGPKVFAQDSQWNTTWGCALQLTEPRNIPPPPGLTSNTLRQIVHASLGGKQLRVRFSNRFGTNAVAMNAVHLALNPGPVASSAINSSTDTALAFHGKTSTVIPVGEEIISDPVNFQLPPLANLAVTIFFGETSGSLTGHPGSRTTSYLATGNAVASTDLAGAAKTEHWYHLTSVEVLTPAANSTLVVLGDSITDGRGSTTDANNRWPDELARRFQTNASTAGIGVVNAGIGGNAIFGGIGPAAVKRFERDVLDRNGVRWLIIFEGVNDIGGRNSSLATATNLIAAYQQFATQAHAKNIRVYGATITPFGGNSYDTDEHEAERQMVNAWMRTNKNFDAVIDFDAAVRQPLTPTKLQAAYDSDHLHLRPAGYHALADAVDLKLFAPGN